MVFIGACFIIAEVGPSALDTALMVLEWVIKLKMPDMMYKMKSPRTCVPIPRPIRLNISTITPMPTSDCAIDTKSPIMALPFDLRTWRTVAWKISSRNATVLPMRVRGMLG